MTDGYYDSRKDGDGASDALTVSQAMGVAKHALEGLNLVVIGEISELSDKPGYKAVYFTLTDKSSAMPCLMWRNVFDTQDIHLEVGMLVEVSGTFSLYVQKGRMNFQARTIHLAGEGVLRQKVALLAEKLRTEGLMDSSRKRALPYLPERIGLVTSPRGKAVSDCLRTLRRRYPLGTVCFCGVTVEGAEAPSELAEGLRVAAEAGVEVILLVRGGGSYEDLMPFNDEGLARAIAACPVPVVTGIGHEPDNSIADMVADMRCSTPTAAAESLAPSVEELDALIGNEGLRLARALRFQMREAENRVGRIAERPIFTDANAMLSESAMMLDADRMRLQHAIPDSLSRDGQRIEVMRTRMERLPKSMYTSQERSLAVYASRLHDLSPLATLSRGYAIAYDEANGRVLDSIRGHEDVDEIRVRVKDGSFLATVHDRIPAPREVDGSTDDKDPVRAI